MIKTQLLDSSRGRIVTLLRRGALTADDIASELRVTGSAIRAHITGMERDGVVRTGRSTSRHDQAFARLRAHL